MLGQVNIAAHLDEGYHVSIRNQLERQNVSLCLLYEAVALFAFSALGISLVFVNHSATLMLILKKKEL